jgi:hypothetical protein
MNRVSPEVLSTRYSRGTAIAAVLITAAWHGLNDGLTVIANWSEYRWPATVLVAWLCYTAVATVNSVEILRHGIVRFPWCTVGLALSISGATSIALRGEITTLGGWAYGSVGWLGVMACWGRPLTPLIALFVSNTAVSGVILFVEGSPNRLAVALLLGSGYGAVALQLGFTVGARALSSAARWAVEATIARSETEARRLVGEQAHEAGKGAMNCYSGPLPRLWKVWLRVPATQLIHRFSGAVPSKRRGCAGCSWRLKTCQIHCCTRYEPASTWPNDAVSSSTCARSVRCRRFPWRFVEPWSNH